MCYKVDFFMFLFVFCFVFFLGNDTVVGLKMQFHMRLETA